MKTSIIRKALVLLMVLVCQQVHAHDFEVNGIYYGISLFNKNTAYVTHKGKDYAQSYAYSGSINIPDKVTYNGKTYTVATIGGYAFWNCADLKSVTLPNTITDIHQHAFEGCHGLETIAIPASVNKIHDQAFFNCHKLNLIELKHTTPPTLGNGVFEGVNYNQARLKVPFSAYNTYKNNSTWNSFKLAHYDVNGIYYQPVSNSQVKVSYRNIYDENSGTFYNSYSGNVTIPSEVTIDGNKCTVTSIGEKAFSESGGLKSVVIPSSVHTIEEQAFYDCFSMTSVTIGNGVTTINSSAFHGCTGLTSVTIPNSVTNIGDYAFTGCSSIKTLSLGSKVSNISNYAFYGCKGLISVTSLNPTPPTCGENVFKNVNVSNVTLTVPTGSVSKYKSADTWKDFKYEQTEEPSEPELPTDNSGLSYNIISETDVEVIAGAEEYSGDIIIPSQTTIDGKVYNVTKVGNKAFYECTGLTSVTIPNSVTSIGWYAFAYCSGLTSITIPEGVASIVYYAFAYCDGLTSVTIPNSVTSIGERAFDYCSGLTSIVVESGNTVYDSRDNCNAIIETSTNTLITGCKNTVIPNSVTSIGDGAFKNCSSLTSISIPSSVTSIGDDAFYYCDGLTSVTIGNSVTSIGDYAFCGCSGLTSVTIPNSVTIIGSSAFSVCCGLTSVTIPNSVISIGESAFYYCWGLTSVTIPNSVTSIGDDAFKNCSGLTSVTIPNSVTSIGNYAFQYCSGLTSVISLNPTPPTCGTAVFNNVSVGNITLEVPAESVSLYQSADTWKDFGSIKGIADEEPELPTDNSGLSYNIISETEVEVIAGTEIYTGDIVIPSQTTIDGKAYNVTKIGDQAFYKCTGLLSITIPNSVTKIGYAAFYYCSGLTGVTIPNSVTSIGNYAFRDCTNLTSVTIPEGVTSIGDNAFFNCSGLESIIVESGNTKYDSRNNCNAIIVTSTNTLITGCKNTTIPNGVTSIGSEAFSDCSGLTSVTIPNSVTSIGDYAFSWCSGLISITIPESVTSIGNYAFYKCSGLTSVTIPNSVTSIGVGAFAHCSGLESIIVESGNTKYDSRDNCNAIIATSTNTLITGCKNTTIPESVTSIGDYAFDGCTGLKSITIPNSVTSIGDYAFYWCYGLTSVTIGNSVTCIGSYAFAQCNGLTSVISLNPTPPTCGTSVFGNVRVGNITLEVPSESISLYQSADTWKDFGTFEAYISYPVGLSKMWAIPADAATGLCSVRTGNGFGDTFFGSNYLAGVIEEWKDGVLVKSYDVNTFCATNQLGEEVDQKDEAGNVTGKTFHAYTLWTAVMVDDAGNVLANVCLGAGSATTCQNWILLPASDRTAMQFLHIDEFPSADVTLGRVDVPANLVGDITGDGAYLHIPATNSAIMPVMFIGLDDDGKIYYDLECSWALSSATSFDASTNVATFQTVDDILAATTEEEVAAKTYVRWRSQGLPFTWNTETSQFASNISLNQGAATPGMGVFAIDGVEYMVVPVLSETTGNRCSSVAVYNLADNTEVASWDSECAVNYFVGSVTARTNPDGKTANIYVCGHKDCFGILKFNPGSSVKSIANEGLSYGKGSSALDEIVTEENAAVEYYNLQGVRVMNPEKGIYIKREGNKVTKVVL